LVAVVLRLLLCSPLEQHRNFLGVLLEVLEGKRPQVPKECPIAYRDMMTRCWHAKAEKRPTMNEVVDVLSQLVSVDSIL